MSWVTDYKNRIYQKINLRKKYILKNQEKLKEYVLNYCQSEDPWNHYHWGDKMEKGNECYGKKINKKYRGLHGIGNRSGEEVRKKKKKQYDKYCYRNLPKVKN